MYVSVSAYDDAALLEGALASVREHLPDATIDVVDGRYRTWPADHDASSDHTATVCAAFDARYRVSECLPFDREVNKHRYRVRIAPTGERALFLDADERLAAFDPGALGDAASAVRIFNPLVYSQSPIRYWPRVFDPATVREVSRWDKYLFDVPCDRTDAVTIAHRHDLRDRAYREAKYERFRNEGRDGRYADRFEQYLADDWAVDTEPCPQCDRDSLVRSPVTNETGDLSRVAVCVAGDGCYRDLEAVAIGTYRYVPDDWRRGLDEAPARLRAELLDAGCPFVAMTDFTTLRRADQLTELRGAIKLWIEHAFGDREHAFGS